MYHPAAFTVAVVSLVTDLLLSFSLQQIVDIFNDEQCEASACSHADLQEDLLV